MPLVSLPHQQFYNVMTKNTCSVMVHKDFGCAHAPGKPVLEGFETPPPNPSRMTGSVSLCREKWGLGSHFSLFFLQLKEFSMEVESVP